MEIILPPYMSSAELKILLFREIDQLPPQDLQAAYQVLMNWLQEQKASQKPQTRPLGSLKGMLQHMSKDFDAPLPEFKDYMP